LWIIDVGIRKPNEIRNHWSVKSICVTYNLTKSYNNFGEKVTSLEHLIDVFAVPKMSAKTSTTLKQKREACINIIGPNM